MISFTGRAGPQRKVDLRGKSRAEESREEVLEKARLQREKRQRAKLEQRSALAIQSRWRQACTAREYANVLRADWKSAFGSALDESSRRDFQEVVNRDFRCVSMLLRFYDPEQEDDRISLAVVCRALSAAAGQGTSTLLVHAAASADVKQQATSGSSPERPAAADPSQHQLALFRVNKLAALCLATLSRRSAACSSVLRSQFSALASLHAPEAALMDLLIKIINPETWKASIANQPQPQLPQPAAAATAGAAAVLRHLYHKQLYSHLRQILQAVPPGLPGKTIVEVLVTQLAIRSISLQLGTTHTPAAATAGAASHALQQGLCQLLFVPNLWARCRSLAPVTGRLCALGLSDICQQANSRDLLAALSSALLAPAAPQPPVAGIAGADANWTAASAALVALVENLLEALAAGSFLKGTEGDQHTAGQVVTALASVIEAERQLTALQKQLAQQQQQRKRPQGSVQAEQQQRPKAGMAFVPGAGFMVPQGTADAGPPAASLEPAHQTHELQPEQHDAMEVDADIAPLDAVATAGGAALSSTAAPAAPSKPTWLPVKPSVYSAEEAAQQQQSSNQSCFHLLAGTTNGTQLLRKLAALMLPATNAADSAKLQQQWIDRKSQPPTQAAGASIVPGGPEQQQLCVLLWALSRPMQYRQRICLGLSVGVRLVPRLWFSYILPLHLSSPGGLLTLGTAAASSSTSGPGGGSSGGWVLPLLVLVQAYSASLSFTHLEDFYAEAAPLLPLQQLYDSSNPAAGLVMLLKSAVWQILWNEVGTSVSASQQEQQQLKRTLGEMGGLLLCQLHDRNCTRQYCPPGAFLADIPSGRVLQEVASRGGAEGALGFESDADEDDLGFNALEQQQQWQRQRQQGIAGVASPTDNPAAAAAGDTADQQQQGEEGGAAVPAAGGVVIGPGNAVQTVGGFGFASNDPVQQRRQQAAQQGAAGSAAAAALAPVGAASRVWLVLQHAPCLIPFQERVQLFQSVVSAEKEAAADAVSHSFMFDDPIDIMMGAGNKFVTIRRDQLLDDSYSQLKAMNADRLKGRLRIAYVNEAGLSEAGIDGGGLFKDFMEELLKQGFSPQAKLFTANPQHQLYPSPFARQLVPDAEGQLQFLGRMLGKSLYEGILLELPLAAFFLRKMRGGVCDINDLRSLDLEVYTNLLQLRHYKGDFAELALNFTATVVEPTSDSATSSSSMPRQHEIELKPGGRDIPVRSDNVTEYIHRLADFRLNRQMDWAASACLRGFFELIKPRWVRMFNEAELQMLISGSEEGIDVDDLVAHVNYAGGYHEEHPVIQTLWAAVRSFTPQQQRQFLKFVTSCSRAPLLGFAYLEPGLCVQMSGSVLNAGSRQRLPTAATCMNLLKLPPYVGFDEMREKLLYAVTAGAGFELS